MTDRRLDLRRIRDALLAVGESLDRIEAIVGSRRDPLSARVVENLLAGYALVEYLVLAGIDLFAMGEHKHMLELNRLALCGAAEECEYAGHVAATEQRFYEERFAGIEDVVEWYRLHEQQSVWDRAAGVYIRALSTPQLFIEGNQRTGTLLVSYVLMRAGQPPFVLTVGNAADYFGHSAVIRTIRKNSLTELVRFPGVQRRFAKFLRGESGAQFVSTAGAAVGTMSGSATLP